MCSDLEVVTRYSPRRDERFAAASGVRSSAPVARRPVSRSAVMFAGDRFDI